MKRLTSVVIAIMTLTSSLLVLPSQSVDAAGIGSSGNFRKVEQQTRGRATIIQVGDQKYLELSAGFKTSTDGPDLKVILYSGNRIPLNIKGKPYVKLGALKKYAGKQRYEIPSDLDLSLFKTVGIYCEKYDATFGYARLN